MTHDKLEVAIMDGDRLILKWLCTRIILSDGRPGVLWRGSEYPLRAGDQIDVNDLAQSSSPRKSWAILIGEETTWILLQGLASERIRVQAILEANNFPVRRTGRWLGEPHEEEIFDWFICCDGKLNQDRVAALLGSQPQTEHEQSTRIEILEQSLSSLRIELAARDATIERFLRAGATAAPSPSPKIVDAPVEEPPPPTLLVSNQEPIASARPLLTRSTTRLWEELDCALSAFRPDVVYLRDSLQVAAGEFTSRAGFYRSIQDLPREGGRPAGWKSVRGAERWWERHVSTGQDDSGRIYARFDVAERQWSVLVGWKVEQLRDIEWLRRKG